MVILESTMSTFPASREASNWSKGMVSNLALTPMPAAIVPPRSISNPLTTPVLVFMLNGGMVPAVPTTSSPFFKMRSSTGESDREPPAWRDAQPESRTKATTIAMIPFALFISYSSRLIDPRSRYSFDRLLCRYDSCNSESQAMEAPRHQVDEKTRGEHLVALPLIHLTAEGISQSPGFPGQIIPGNTDASLAPESGEVHHDQPPFLASPPAPAQQIQVAGVIRPAAPLTEPPVPVSEYGVLADFEQPAIEG